MSVLAALGVGWWFMARTTPTEEVAASSVATTTSVSIEPGSSSTTIDESPPVPARGGTLRIGLVGDEASLNPYLVGSDRSLTELVHLVAASAFELEPTTHDLRAGVLAELPTLDNGGLARNDDGTMTVDVRIADAAAWSDGTPITGADFLRTYQIVMAHRDIIFPDVLEAYDRLLPASVAVDDRHVRFVLDRPTLDLTGLFRRLVPAHQVSVEGFATDWNDTMWASAGPYRFDASDGPVLRFVRNDEFSLSDANGVRLPYVDVLEVHRYDSIDDAVAALASGEVEVAGPIRDPALVATADAIEGVRLEVRRGPGWEHIGIQFGPGAQLANEASVVGRREIRRAILAALDRDAIAEAAQGVHGEALESITGLGWPTIEDGRWDGAGDLPGRLTGVTIALAATGGDAQRQTIVSVVTDQLAAEGVLVVSTLEEPGRFFADVVLPGAFELAEWSWLSSPGPGGVASDMASWFTSTGSQQLDFARWSAHPDAAAFVERSAGLVGTVSHEELAGLLVELEELLAEQVALIPLFAELNVGAASTDVRGFDHSAVPGGLLAEAHRWWVSEG